VSELRDALDPFPPRIRLRIGVSGHRTAPKLPAGSEIPLRAVLDPILAAIVETARGAASEYAALASARRRHRSAPQAQPASPADRAGAFVVVSALAEGSDRIVAEAGLAAGFGLESVLPFDRAEYARDFATPESRATFEQMLARSAAVFELSGAPDQRARAYEAAGLVMLANIDLLIAVWDGEEAAGIGGTAQIVGRAVTDGIPVLWIDPANPSALKFSWSHLGELTPTNANAHPRETFRPADMAALELVIKDILSLPTKPEERQSLVLYLREKERRWNFCPWYPLLLRVLAGRALRSTDFHFAPALADTKKQWQGYLTALPKDRSLRPAIERVLLPACSAADHLAVYYSLVYRSTYVFNFLFAAMAVALALLGLFIHEPTTKSYFVLVELLIIVAILITWLRGHREQWHRRWLEYRRLAESLRHLRILAPIGSEGPVGRPRPGLEVDEQDWVDWYAWSVRRLLPLPDCAVSSAYLEAIRGIVRTAEIAEQVDYHSRNAARIAKLEPRMHEGGQLLFLITGGVCLAFIGLVWLIGLPDAREERVIILGIFTFLTALLPTLGSAMGAIYVQGDFKTVAEQSKRTAKRLSALDRVLEIEPLSFARLADRIEKTSDIMMSDLLEWQTVFRTRHLSLPA